MDADATAELATRGGEDPRELVVQRVHAHAEPSGGEVAVEPFGVGDVGGRHVRGRLGDGTEERA